MLNEVLAQEINFPHGSTPPCMAEDSDVQPEQWSVKQVFDLNPQPSTPERVLWRSSLDGEVVQVRTQKEFAAKTPMKVPVADEATSEKAVPSNVNTLPITPPPRLSSPLASQDATSALQAPHSTSAAQEAPQSHQRAIVPRGGKGSRQSDVVPRGRKGNAQRDVVPRGGEGNAQRDVVPVPRGGKGKSSAQTKRSAWSSQQKQAFNKKLQAAAQL